MSSSRSPRHRRLARAGVSLVGGGLLLLMVGFLVGPDQAVTAVAFEGTCVGSGTAGTCVLDEPEGKNPGVHGFVTYGLRGRVMTFVVTTPAAIDEVQICMQTTGPFAHGANVCAGSHGPHVGFASEGSTYTVDLGASGLTTLERFYWTLHVVSGGRTLQVNGGYDPIPTTTTTIGGSTTTTSGGSTTTTTTTTGGSTTTSGVSTTTVAPQATSTSLDPVTSTTRAVNVLGRELARTGPQKWLFVSGGVVLLIGLTSLGVTHVLRER